METGGVRRLNRSSPSCLNTPAQRTDFFHGLLRRAFSTLSRSSSDFRSSSAMWWLPKSSDSMRHRAWAPPWASIVSWGTGVRVAGHAPMFGGRPGPAGRLSSDAARQRDPRSGSLFERRTVTNALTATVERIGRLPPRSRSGRGPVRPVTVSRGSPAHVGMDPGRQKTAEGRVEEQSVESGLIAGRDEPRGARGASRSAPRACRSRRTGSRCASATCRSRPGEPAQGVEDSRRL